MGPIFTLSLTIRAGCSEMEKGKEIEGWSGCGNGNDIGFSIGVPPGSVGFLMIVCT